MDRGSRLTRPGIAGGARRGPVLSIAMAMAVALAGCGSSSPVVSRRELSHGALSYRALISGERVLAAELRQRFELIAYPLRGGDPLWRRDIGPADYDVTALVGAAGIAWVGSRDGTVRGYRIDSGRYAVGWSAGAAITAMTSAAGQYLLTATDTGVLCLRRIRDGALLHCVVAHPSAVADLDACETAGGWRVVSSAHDGSVAVWALPSMRRLRQTRLSGSANAVALAPSGEIAVGVWSQPLERTPAIAGREKQGLADVDPQAALVTWRPGKQPQRRLGHAGPITDLAWTGDGEILSTSWDRSVRLWRRGRSRPEILFRTPYLAVDLAANPDAGGGIWALASWTRRPGEPATQVFGFRGAAAIDGPRPSSLK